MGKLIIISGEKGGVGKSMVCHGVIDILLNESITKESDNQTQEGFTVIDTDITNMDIYKTYSKYEIGCELIDIRGENEEIEFLNAIEEHKDKTIIVNMCAGAGMGKYGNNLVNLCEELGVSMTVLWVINTDRDSIELLSEYITKTEDSKGKYKIYAIKNLYFGKEQMFRIYDESKTSKKVNGVFLFPKLNTTISPHITNNRYSLKEAQDKADKVTIRQTIHTYRKEIYSVLKDVLNT